MQHYKACHKRTYGRCHDVTPFSRVGGDHKYPGTRNQTRERSTVRWSGWLGHTTTDTKTATEAKLKLDRVHPRGLPGKREDCLTTDIGVKGQNVEKIESLP